MLGERLDALVLESRQLRIPYQEVLDMLHERQSAIVADEEKTGKESEENRG